MKIEALTLVLVFYGITFAVWLRRSVRLLITLAKVPRLTQNTVPVPGGELPFVSVLIPAKNESKNIAGCLESVKALVYPAFEIITINDNSSDNTAALIQGLGVPCLNAPPTPEGWTGKNSALHAGVQTAKGEWLLFTDADTRHKPKSLAAALAYARSRNLELLSLLPHCLTHGFFEKMIQPPAMAFLGVWFPLEKVNHPGSKLYFANGQYLLIKRSLYEKIGGHQSVAGEFLEDFALFRRAKELGARAECVFGTELYGTRMYDSIDSMWRGWRRIYLHAFRKNPAVLLLKAASMFFFSCLPFALFPFFAAPLAARFGAAAALGALTSLIGIVAVCWRGYGMVKAPRIFAFLFPAAAAFMALFLLDAAQIAFLGKKTFWR